MRQETFERGSGMTRKRYVRIDFDNFAEYVEYLEGEPTYEEELRNLMEFCQRRLRANGLPDTMFVRLGKNRREAIHDHIIERLGHDEDTDAGYAARILWHAHLALDPSTQKRKWDFAYYIDRAASLNREAVLKFGKGEKLALWSEERLKQLSNARADSVKIRRKNASPLWKEFISDAKSLREKNPRLKLNDVATRIQARRNEKGLPNKTVRTITTRIKHLWPKKV